MRRLKTAWMMSIFLGALPALAQEVDTDWDGPDVPEIKRVEGGGIEYTGKWYTRKHLVKYSDIHAIHREGFPRAVIWIDGKPRAIMTTKSLGAIDRYYGGEGHVPAYQGEIEIFNPDVWADEDRTSKLPKARNPEIALDDLPPRDGAIDLDQVATENGPIELFSDAEIGAINPIDGTWVSRVDKVEASGCPPGVETAAMGSVSLGQSQSITFSKPWWDPSDISAAFGKYAWRPVGANGYFSTPYETGPEAKGSGMSLAVTMALRAKSPDEIAYWGRVNVNLAPALAAMVGGTAKCRAVVKGTLKRQG